MRYASIRSMDISNGEGVGISLFVQGCHFHCKNCFNPETWDFNGGKEWTPEVEDKFIELASRPYIKRISLLGGECLADENLDGVLNLINKIRLLMPEKTIWLYTGYTFEQIMKYEYGNKYINNFNVDGLRQIIVSQLDVLVDGKYIDSKRNLSKKWCGSDNQRVINIKESLKQDKIILHCD